MKNSLFLILFVSLSFCALAQTGSSLVSPYEGLSGRLRLLPPNVSNIEQYGNIPVNFSTGQLNFSLPLYEIPVDENFKIPIRLSYNNNGLKPEDVPSWVGNGWNLELGGSIVQYVNGMSDFDISGGMKNATIRQQALDYMAGSMSEPNKYLYISDVLNNQKDSQYDIFSFNFMGKSGKFYFYGDSIIIMNKMPLKVSYGSNSFTITDELGYQYAFAQFVTNSGSFTDGYLNPVSSPFYLSSVTWYLTKITSPNGVVVDFTYEQDITYRTNATGTSYATGSIQNGWDGCINSNSFSPYYTNTQTYIDQKLVKEISWKGKKITFQTTTRNDIENVSGTKGKALSGITVYDEANVQVKNIGFAYGYLGTNDRLKLNSVSVQNNGTSVAVQTHTFEYYEQFGLSVPIPSLVTSTSTHPANNSVDHWGYYNGVSNSDKIPQQNYSLITSTTIPSFGNADRRANGNSSRIGMLKKINYPTKGFTEITYEPNIVTFANAAAVPFFMKNQSPETPPPGGGINLQVGGNRVSRIVDNSGTAESNERIITYEQSNLLAEPYYVSSIIEGKSSNSDGPCTSCGLKYFISENNIFRWDGYHVEYLKVTESYGSTAANGKKVYEFAGNYFVGAPPSAPPFSPTLNLNWRTGNLTKDQTYEKNASSFTLVKEQSNTYNTLSITPFTRKGFKAGRTMNCLQQSVSSSFSYDYFNYQQTPVFSDYYNLQSVATAEYSGGVGLSSTISYTYTPEVLLKSTSTTNSKNKTESTVNYYANDFNNIAGTNIDQLKIKNIIGLPLKVIRNVDNKAVEGVMVKSDANGNPIEIYRYENASLVTLTHNPAQFILPEFKLFESRKFSSKGNPIEIKRLNQPPTTYVWGYKHSYPIASVQNASVANVEAVIGSLETVADTYSPSGVESIGTNLRSGLPLAMVTSGVMKSGIGLSQMTAPNGLKNTYEYDGINRLNSIKDHAGNLTDLYRYFYATASEPCTIPPAPVISITATTLCSVTLTATGCTTGTVQWSNGASGTSTSVGTTTSTSYTAKCKNGTCESTASNALTVPVLPSTWSAMDIGTPSAPGCTQNSSGNLTMLGYGPEGTASDKFHWIYKAFSGNVTVIAKISSIPAVDGNRSGFMIRSNLNADAQYYTLIQDGNAHVGELKRDVNGGTGGLYSFAASALNQTWIKVVKTGSTIKGYYSTDSNPEVNNAWNDYFNLTGNSPTTLDFGSNFYIGFALWGNANQTTFTNITINGVAF